MKHVKTFESYTQKENNHIGINWQSDFTQEERNTIKTYVEKQISDMVVQGYSSGELNGEKPNYN